METRSSIAEGQPDGDELNELDLIADPEEAMFRRVGYEGVGIPVGRGYIYGRAKNGLMVRDEARGPLKFWTITRVKSGRDLGLVFTTPETALECCEALLATGRDWEALGGEEAGGLGDDVMRAAVPSLLREADTTCALLSLCHAHLEQTMARLRPEDTVPVLTRHGGMVRFLEAIRNPAEAVERLRESYPDATDEEIKGVMTEVARRLQERARRHETEADALAAELDRRRRLN